MPSQGFLYTAAVPESNSFRNADLNPLGAAGDYAGTYTHDTNNLIRRVVRELIYDATPKQFLDLAIVGMKSPEQVMSDEFHYHEVGFGREPLTVNEGAGVGSAATQTFNVDDASLVSVDTILVYPDNTKGIVTSVNTGTNEIVVSKYNTAANLPALADNAVLGILSPVEADGSNSFSQYYRVDTVERTNYVQMLAKAVRFGKMEQYKYANARTTQNFMDIIKQKMLFQFRVDLANIYWNGQQGEVTLANGAKAKTAGGIYPIMVDAGSPNDDVTLANAPDALEDLMLDTEYGAYGDTKFIYAAPRVIHYLTQEYKRDLTRYAPNDDVAKLGLSSIDIGSTKGVFVPIKRFEEPSCFSAGFASRIFLLDQESITPAFVFPEEMGETGNRSQGFYNNFTDSWISATWSLYYNNPVGGGYLNITDLP